MALLDIDDCAQTQHCLVVSSAGCFTEPKDLAGESSACSCAGVNLIPRKNYWQWAKIEGTGKKPF